MRFDDIHNYYEHLVVDEIMHTLSEQEPNQDFLKDVACLALNKLPARYVRHDVDMAFYLTSAEHEQMQHSVAEAVREAAAYVRRSRGQGAA